MAAWLIRELLASNGLARRIMAPNPHLSVRSSFSRAVSCFCLVLKSWTDRFV